MSLDVHNWLCRLGLEQYVKAFRDNAIDAEVLPRLTAQDLKDLGVTLVGHRRLLRDAQDARRRGPEDALQLLPRHAEVGAVLTGIDVVTGREFAHDLAQRGVSVLLLDRAGRTKPCGGAIGGAAGWRRGPQGLYCKGLAWRVFRC